MMIIPLAGIFLIVFGVYIAATPIPSPQSLSDERRKFFEDQRRVAAAARQRQKDDELTKVDYLVSTLDTRFSHACSKGDDRIYFTRDDSQIFFEHIPYFRNKCNEQGYIFGKSGYMESHGYWAKPKG